MNNQADRSPVFVWRTTQPPQSLLPIRSTCRYCAQPLTRKSTFTAATAAFVSDWSEAFARRQEEQKRRLEQGFSTEREGLGWDPYDYYHPVGEVCPRCGWWVEGVLAGHGAFEATLTQAAALRQFDIGDVDLSTEELLSHLSKRSDDFHRLPPHRFEEVVASVFSHTGYKVIVTKRTRDGGTDLICVGRGADLHIVECKRYAARRRVGIGIVDRLLGVQFRVAADAATIVTTSSFSKPAQQAADEANDKGAMLSLVDAHDLLRLCEVYADPTITPDDLCSIFVHADNEPV